MNRFEFTLNYGDYITKLEPNEVFVFGANPLLSSYSKCPLYCPILEIK